MFNSVIVPFRIALVFYNKGRKNSNVFLVVLFRNIHRQTEHPRILKKESLKAQEMNVFLLLKMYI